MKKDELLDAFNAFEKDGLSNYEMKTLTDGLNNSTGTSGCATGDTMSGTNGKADDCDCDVDDSGSDTTHVPTPPLP